MKNYMVVLTALCVLFVACGGSNNNTNDEKTSGLSQTTASNTQDISQNPDYKKGLALVAKSSCLTCHKISGISTGPSYQDVANKYTADSATINMLAAKIISGGSGHWGSVPMIAHPDISTADAKQMVKYILLLKSE